MIDFSEIRNQRIINEFCAGSKFEQIEANYLLQSVLARIDYIYQELLHQAISQETFYIFHDRLFKIIQELMYNNTILNTSDLKVCNENPPHVTEFLMTLHSYKFSGPLTLHIKIIPEQGHISIGYQGVDGYPYTVQLDREGEERIREKKVIECNTAELLFAINKKIVGV